jgi:hypothetical protein
MWEPSEEEKEILKRITKQSKKDYAAVEKFKMEEYPKKSLDEKIDYWTDQIHKSMRWQGESTGDEYGDGFTQEWYDECLAFDPVFVNIFPIVVQRLNIDVTKISEKIK